MLLGDSPTPNDLNYGLIVQHAKQVKDNPHPNGRIGTPQVLQVRARGDAKPSSHGCLTNPGALFCFDKVVQLSKKFTNRRATSKLTFHT